MGQNRKGNLLEREIGVVREGGLVGEYSQTADKSVVGTLMSTLTTMKFDGSRTMYEHVIEMINIAARLKTLGI